MRDHGLSANQGVIHERFIPGLPDQLEARAINFAAVDFEMSPLVVIALCVPSRESEVRA